MLFLLILDYFSFFYSWIKFLLFVLHLQMGVPQSRVWTTGRCRGSWEKCPSIFRSLWFSLPAAPGFLGLWVERLAAEPDLRRAADAARSHHNLHLHGHHRNSSPLVFLSFLEGRPPVALPSRLPNILPHHRQPLVGLGRRSDVRIRRHASGSARQHRVRGEDSSLLQRAAGSRQPDGSPEDAWGRWELSQRSRSVDLWWSALMSLPKKSSKDHFPSSLIMLIKMQSS